MGDLSQPLTKVPFRSNSGVVDSIWDTTKSYPEIIAQSNLRDTDRSEARTDLRQYQNISCDAVRTKLLEGKSCIWDFSDTSAWFISGLYHNNPSERRKQLETLVHLPLSRQPSDSSQNGKIFHRRYESFERTAEYLQSSSEEILLEEKELTEVVRKIIDLMTDMLKSVEVVFHAFRACAKFLSFPTPSVPSDNYVFGQVKGWLWLIYKGLFYLTPRATDIAHNVNLIHQDLSNLSREIEECIKDLEQFVEHMKKLQKEMDKETKYLKSRGGIWEMKMTKCLNHLGRLAERTDLLVDTSEDKYFGSNWIYEPLPSGDEKNSDFFHFQWVRMEKDTEFEIRSDYSERWLPFSKFDGRLQMDIVHQMILHLTSMLSDAKDFNDFHLHLTFDYEEFRCLKITLNELAKKKDNSRTSALLANMISEFFQAFANLLEIVIRFQEVLMEVSTLIIPLYNTVKRWSKDTKLFPLDHIKKRKVKIDEGCCRRRKPWDFLEVYGDPLAAVLLRTPISKNVITNYFPTKNPMRNNVPNAVDKFGLSRGYQSSVFDKVLGRDPPVKPFRVLQSKRIAKNVSFDVLKFHQHCKLCIRKEDRQLDLEMYILIFDQITKFILPIFSWANSDLNSKIESMEKLIYGPNSSAYETAEKMAEYESSAQFKEKTKSNSVTGWKTFTKLHRTFVFISLVMERLVALEENETTYYAFKVPYTTTLLPYSSWFTQKAAAYSFYFLPNKRNLYEKYEITLTIKEVDEVLTDVVKLSKKIVNHCETMFSTYSSLDST